MMTYESNGVTVVAVLEKRQKKQNVQTENKPGEQDRYFYVKIRVTYQRTPKYFPTGKKVTEIEWQSLPHTKRKKLLETRKDIEIKFDEVKTAVQDLLIKNQFSFERLMRINKGQSKATLYDHMQAKIAVLNENHQIGTKKSYECALAHIQKLMGKTILLSDINVKWLQCYERKALKEGMSYTSIGMYLRNIRHILGRAKQHHILTEEQYPFGKDKYTIPVGVGQKKALTLSDIKAIMHYQPASQATERYRDLWLFSYFANGANFADILRLTYGNIHDGEISFLRQKTQRTTRVKKHIQVFMTPEMQRIIEKWGNPNQQPHHYLFPHLTGNETPAQEKTRIETFINHCNKHMKRIAKALGITQSISTYTARHSYATVLKRSGANVAYIAESLGHHDLRTTEHYLASFEKEEREKNAKLLLDF